LICGCDGGCGPIHPSHKQGRVQEVQTGKRYWFTSLSAYALYARLDPSDPSSKMRARFFTSEDPDDPGGDDDRFSLSTACPERHPSAPHLPFETGIYCEVIGDIGALAFIEVDFVARQHYCCAMKRPEAFTRECWNAARPGESFGDWDAGVTEEEEWSNSGTADASGDPIEAEAGGYLEHEETLPTNQQTICMESSS